MPNTKPKSDGHIFDKTNVTLLAAGLAAIGLAGLLVQATPRKLSGVDGPQAGVHTQISTASAAKAGQPANAPWATSAPGRVEPKGGEIQLRPEANGRITNIYVTVGEHVEAGDLIAQLRADDDYARLVQARAEVAVRTAERDEEEEAEQGEEAKQKRKRVQTYRKTVDALGAAERAYHNAWIDFDATLQDYRAKRASDNDLAAARKAIKDAEQTVADKSGALTILEAKPETPLPTRLDSGLTLARADLRLAEIAYMNKRVRAPVGGKVLRLDGRVGEMASSNQRRPFAVLGDMSAIQITAEVPERDVSKVHVGQSVIVRSNAFANTEFRGQVTEVAPSVGSPGLRAQGPRQQLDAEVLEVKIVLEGQPSVLPGMRVDVFFKAEQRVSSATN